MGSWSPSRLPKIRDSVCRLLNDPESPLRSSLARSGKDGTTAELQRVADDLTAGQLYWVAPQMAALSVGAAETIPQVRWTVEERPSERGLIVFDGGVGTLEEDGASYPVDALSWGPRDGGLIVWFWVARSRMEEAAAHNGMQIVVEQVPPLVPYLAWTLPVSSEWQLPSEIPGDYRTVLTTLAAAWSLMQQPTIVEHIPVEADRKVRAAYARAGRGEPEATLVELRRQYRLSGQPPLDPDQPGRHYKHRWIVRGHWRQQAYGPERSLRRQTWIASHVKGPEGADLLETAKVNVWRR
ncbi:hypothetical protein AB0F72_08950 [Actinoplanes sp. NPDC023936]|uniref:hypothetical protein n=1 Tax=Actinoplanes sp. NPDC023936 TaxID=3154910 RepID=UPI0033DE397A